MGLFKRLFRNDGFETTALFEITTQEAALKVDAEKGLIKDVKVLGRVSNNKRRYTDGALKGSVKIYEGMKVNVNHGQAPGQRRDLEDLIGVLRNVNVQEDGVFGDLQFNPKHRFADQLVWNAVNDPANIGFSHDATCRHSREGGVVVIHEILDVKSCDIVGQPATTCGLFESEEPKTMKRTIQQIAKAAKGKCFGATRLLQLCEADGMVGEVPIAEVPVDVPVEASADDAVRAAFKAAILAVIDDESLDTSAMMKRISELLKAKDKIEDAGEEPEAEAATGAATEEGTQSNPAGKGGDGGGVTPDGKTNAVVKELKEEVHRMKSRDAVRRLLDKHGNPVIEEDLFEALCDLPNNTAREAILANLGTPSKKKAERPRTTGTSKIHESLDFGGAEVKDGASFAKSICR